MHFLIRANSYNSRLFSQKIFKKKVATNYTNFHELNPEKSV
jgi:hypothetical protein